MEKRLKLKPGEPFPCPKCGATDDWSAWYYDPASQSVRLIVGKDGTPEEADYGGGGGYFGDATETDVLKCGCGHLIRIAEFIMAPVGQDAIVQALVAAHRRKNKAARREAIERALRRLDRLHAKHTAA